MRYVALLRGINVGGRNKVPMARLREVFQEVGHTDVRTYINSGNVVFESPRRHAGVLSQDLEAAFETEFGFPARVLVLPGSTVKQIAAALPGDWARNERSSCNVLYLLPERASPKALEEFRFDPEYEDARYCAGAILSRVDRAHIGRSAVHKLIGTELYSHVTIRNCNAARKLATMVDAV
ncbi:Uncharacterized conserved protein, DUF1697 family [Geodermatophilus obscurus]|uniref:Uncharacterized conserved protein, DUF1697 family n=1 Tax=Geodermatophilus obscurus TaxID=1861 RepID=A0A1M7UXX8_9ACTN|nr:DUF1697 domain-containing protein [Geodermatophilus obscurus]SHN87843.1 Uncharacterized conserved protein, DUF1697 family [Geodermatophilus obscurus]